MRFGRDIGFLRPIACVFQLCMFFACDLSDEEKKGSFMLRFGGFEFDMVRHLCRYPMSGHAMATVEVEVEVTLRGQYCTMTLWNNDWNGWWRSEYCVCVNVDSYRRFLCVCLPYRVLGFILEARLAPSG